ncbi:hypothetical protein [Providencia vermicola]|uniref:hypothetical protein n=1 Tax=Providencia vermicola TaxID=333965 RepID=UPI0032DA4BF7
MEYLENRINQLLSNARQLEIKVAQYEIDYNEWKLQEDRNVPPQYLLDADDEFVQPFKNILRSIYLSTICYLDKQNLDRYLIVFYQIFGNDPIKPKYIDEFDIDHYWSGDLYSVFLAEINKFLAPFEFTESSNEKYERISGIQYLETVLKNTASIISKSGEVPKSEANVYKLVKSTLESIFISSRSPKSNFIKIAKEYKPDILIPELYAAVEYKYAADKEKLKSTIEQIAADVRGYTGDRDYRIFYAVFYVIEDFWGQDKFMEVWKEQDFPQNWIPFYVVGKSQ